MLHIAKWMFSWMGLLAGAAFLTMSGAAAQPAGPHVMVLEGGTLIDGTGKAPVTDVVVVVEGNRIKAVGKRGRLQIPANATVIHTDGRTILPGLIDSHTHTEDWHIPMFLHYGVTTFQDKYQDPAWVMAEREGLQNGTIKGPRMFVGGQNLSGSIFQTDARPAVTVEDARADAKSLVANHVDIINVTHDLTFDQLRAVIEVGKAAGIPVMGHTQNLRISAAMGYRYQEHTWSVATALIDPQAKTNMGLDRSGFDAEVLMDPKVYPFAPFINQIKQSVFINPTLVTFWLGAGKRAGQWQKEAAKMANDTQLAFVPAEVREIWKRYPMRSRQGYANVAEFLKEYVAAGGRVTVGTDAGHRTIPGLSEHYEMQMLVDVGVPPMKAIQAATLWNAQLMMKDKDLGSVEAGKLADFTIIEGNPLADISTTKNVRMVIKDGAVMDTKYDPKWVNPIPAPGSAFDSPPPQIGKVSSAAHQNGPTVTLEIEGGGAAERFGEAMPFKPGSIVRFDNVDLPTTFVSGTKLTATLDAKLLKRAPGFYPLYVVNPGLHGTLSGAAYEVIDTTDTPVNTLPEPYRTYAIGSPTILGPVPRMANQGGQTVNLTIDGSKFTPKSIVRFDRVDLPTKFVSPTKLTATLDAKLLQRTPGSYLLYVVNPGLYGIVSRASHFMVLPKNSKVTWSYIAD